MTERPEDAYYRLILIQGTPPRLIAPAMPFADKRFFVLRLDARLERLFGNFTRLRLFSHACWLESSLVQSLEFCESSFLFHSIG